VDSTGNYTVSEDGKTITFATAADAAGATFTVGHYLVADTSAPSIIQVGGMVESSSNDVNFGSEIKDMSNPIGEAKTYTANGKEFTTDYFVSTFGWLNSRGKYGTATAAGTSARSDDWPETWDKSTKKFQWNWMYDFGATVYDDYTDTAHFLGAKSDDFPLVEFDVVLSDSIADGTYTIDFIDTYINGDHPEWGDNAASFFNASPTTSFNPTTKEGLTIVVGDPTATTEPDTTEPDTTEPDTTEPDTTEPTTATEPTTEPQETKTHDKGHEYAIGDVVFDPAKEDYVMVPVTVWNDPGVYGLSFEFTVDGKTPDDPDFPFVPDGVENGGAYSQTLNFVGNQNALSVIWSCKNEDSNDVAADGATFVELYFAPKDGVEYVPGTVYKVEFAASTVGNQASEVLSPVLTNGSITIAGAEPTTTEPQETTEPDTTEPDTTEPDTTEPDTTEPDTTEPQEATEPQTGDYLYGDVNENGKVELVDIVMLNRFLTNYGGQTLTDRAVVNANCYRNGESDADTTSGNLDGKDSVEILKYLIGLVQTLPTQG